jgi:16S rRNA (cytosine1402-N4)-methyltransferase
LQKGNGVASQLYSPEPVMADEVVSLLQIRPDGIYVDATAGAGGHAERIAEQLNSGRLIAMDRDPEAVDRVQKRLQRYPHAVVVHGNYSTMRTLLGQMKVE